MAWISYHEMRLRMLPIPGTVWSRYTVWASCGLAAWTMCHARSRIARICAPARKTDSRRPARGVGQAGAEGWETSPLRAAGAGWV